MVVPAGVAKISSYAFCYCESLTSISLPEGVVTVVGSNAFYRCSALASVTLPRGLTTVGNMAFWGCRALTKMRCQRDSPASGTESLRRSAPVLTLAQCWPGTVGGAHERLTPFI